MRLEVRRVMGISFYHCKSTSQGKMVDAKNPKDAAAKFVDEMMMGLYTVKIKKVSASAAKEYPDVTIVVTDSNAGKEFYFQYTSMKPKH